MPKRKTRQSRIKRVQKALDKLPHIEAIKKGRRNEIAAKNLLAELASMGKIPCQSTDIELTTPFSKLDGLGYDIIVRTDRGVIGLQVKSSKAYREEFKQKHPHVFCLLLEQGYDPEKVKTEVAAEINRQYELLKKLSKD